MSSPFQYSLHVLIQVVGEFGEPQDNQCWQAGHESVALMQIGDKLENPVVKDDSQLGFRKLEGWYVVDDRELKMGFDEHAVLANLTLFIRMK